MDPVTDMADDDITCRELADFLLAYTTGTLPPARRALFDAHLAECPDCRTYLATYEDTVRAARGAFPDADEPLPAGVPEELVAAILAARRKRG